LSWWRGNSKEMKKEEGLKNYHKGGVLFFDLNNVKFELNWLIK